MLVRPARLNNWKHERCSSRTLASGSLSCSAWSLCNASGLHHVLSKHACDYPPKLSLGVRAAGEREVHAGIALSASGLNGDVTGSHQLVASAARVTESSMAAPPCTCVAIGGVLARLLTSQAPADSLSAGTVAVPTHAAGALASGRRALDARASRQGGGTPAGLAAGGPDPMWVPLYEETEVEALAAAAAPLIQLPPAAAPLPPHFDETVAALPIR